MKSAEASRTFQGVGRQRKEAIEQVCFALIYFDWVCRTDSNRDQDQDQVAPSKAQGKGKPEG
jgi:hypothetical protein